MFIATRFQLIRETEDYAVTEEMISKLDEMLTNAGVTHFFTLPFNQEDGFPADDHVACVFYDDDQDATAFACVYILWSKVVRKLPDEKIKKAMVKFGESN